MRQTIATKSKVLFMYFYGLLLLAMPIRDDPSQAPAHPDG